MPSRQSESERYPLLRKAIEAAREALSCLRGMTSAVEQAIAFMESEQ